MAAIFGEGKIFGKLQRLHSLDPLWIENFAEIALSRTVKEIEANLCFAIFGKNFENSQKWPPFLGIFENFCQNWQNTRFASISLDTLCEIERFRRNRSISHGI